MKYYDDKSLETRDLYIYRDGTLTVVEAETNRAIKFLHNLCGWEWRMLTHTSDENTLLACDELVLKRLMKALKQTNFIISTYEIGAI